jgi:hypothetical protein
MRLLAALVTGVLSGLAVSACARGGGGGAGGSLTSDAGAGDASHDAPASSSHDGAESGPDGGGGPCADGAGRCSGQQPQTCVNGMWQSSGGPCPYVCTSGVCTGHCTPGAQQCLGQQPQLCDSTGTWQNNGPSCPNVCNSGACAGACVPGTTQCSGSSPETCSSNGTWQSGSACPYVCTGGTCTGVCVPGATQCSGSTPQTCDATGTWQSGSACPYTCGAGNCTGSCSPSSTESCAICGTTGTATCNGSYEWGPCAPPAGVCNYVNGSCAASCDTVASCWTGVDRSYNPTSGETFYTTNNAEASCCGFTVQAYDYYYLYGAAQSGTVPFYRCVLSDGFHFYTVSSTCEGAAGSTNEGSMGYIASSAACGSIPLYRLVGGRDHLYTISSSEVTSAEAGGYAYEGIVGYVWTSPEG